jgi:hypothetical protein
MGYGASAGDAIEPFSTSEEGTPDGAGAPFESTDLISDEIRKRGARCASAEEP